MSFSLNMMCLLLLTLYLLVSFANSEFVEFPGDDGVAADQWLVQKLDHFDPSSSRTWWQKYHTNETMFKNARNSPVFLLIGGNQRTTGKSVSEGAFVDYARHFSALCFQIEHRFYGDSRPTDDVAVSSLRFLNADQALADIAFFVKQMNIRYKLTANNRWVVFGKGYAGSLAAWARLKYPHLIHAALSSSAPLRAVAGYSGFNKNIEHALSLVKASCPQQIHQAALHIEKLLKTPDGVQILNRKFKRCNSLDPKNDTDIAFFVDTLASHFRDAVESTLNDLTASTSSRTNLHTVEEILTIMEDEKFGDVLDRYAAVHSLFTFGNLFTSGKCRDDKLDDYIIQYSGKSNFDVPRIWLYQRCSALGLFPISSSENSLFGSLVDLKFYVNTCQLVFGDEFDEKRLIDGVTRTNLMYGGLDLKPSRTIFLVGNMDLWRDLELQKSTNRNSPVIIIEGGRSGADLNIPDDPDQLLNARNTVQKTIGPR